MASGIPIMWKIHGAENLLTLQYPELAGQAVEIETSPVAGSSGSGALDLNFGVRFLYNGKTYECSYYDLKNCADPVE